MTVNAARPPQYSCRADKDVPEGEIVKLKKDELTSVCVWRAHEHEDLVICAFVQHSAEARGLRGGRVGGDAL